MALAETTRRASCLCGSISLSLVGEPVTSVLCHCDSCKKATGGFFQANVFYPTESVIVSDPKNVLQDYQDGSCDSGRVVERYFCRNCGSFIKTQNPTHPQISKLTIVPIGIIDGDKASLTPKQEYYVKRKAGWLQSRDGVAEYQAME